MAMQRKPAAAAVGRGKREEEEDAMDAVDAVDAVDAFDPEDFMMIRPWMETQRYTHTVPYCTVQ